mmetsp:Transcript_11305/g.42356  ORF Transcript_11305/g.42356 Transcript_11305/m.42356 type:complete len:407 (+) Transcript_11305:119-1339(+)
MSHRKPTKLVNIGGDKNDTHYRYKRETLHVRQESATVIVNAYAKTQITNLNVVADQIGRPLKYLIKYFQTALGTQTQYDSVNHLFKLNGLYTTEELEAIVESFIEKFVLCKACGNPETTIKVVGKGSKASVKLKCAACGKSTEVDPTEKITNFITKNPPKTNKMATAATKTEDEPEKTHFSMTDENWNPELDTSPEAVAKRREAERALGFGVQEADDSATAKKAKPSHPVDLLRFFVENHEDASTDVAYKAVAKVRKHFDLTRNETVCLIFEAVFRDESFFKELPKWADLFAKVIKSKKQQIVFLRNLRRLIRTHPKMANQLASIFEKLYDTELIEEDAFLEWNKNESAKEDDLSKQLVGSARPFIEWLERPDEEDEEQSSGAKKTAADSDDDSDSDDSDDSDESD